MCIPTGIFICIHGMPSLFSPNIIPLRNAIAHRPVRPHTQIVCDHVVFSPSLSLSSTSRTSSAGAQRYMVICMVPRTARITSKIYLMNSTNETLPSSHSDTQNPSRTCNARSRVAVIGWSARMYHPAYTFMLYSGSMHKNRHKHQMQLRFLSTMCHVHK